MSIDEELERVMANVSAPEWRKQWVQPVTFDRTSGKYTPATQSEWESVCAAAGVPMPGHTWEAQESSKRAVEPPISALPLPAPLAALKPHSTPDEIADAMESAGWNVGWHRAGSPAPDPLDQVIDGQTLRYLIATDESMQRSDEAVCRRRFTPAQRAAVSAHRSAELRAKVEAKRKADAAAAPSVRYCEVEPWE